MTNTELNSSPEKAFQEIAALREQKGKGSETISLIDHFLNDAHDYLVQLFLEKALVYQHNYMEQETSEQPDETAKSKALSDWEEVLKLAQSHVEEFNLERWNSRLYRFLGRLSDYQGNYDKAIEFYDKALASIDSDPDKIKGLPREFELNGFKAFSFVKLGRVKEGMDLAKTTYDEFDGEKGQKFKQMDYATWAIWKTGIAFRTTEALIGSDVIAKEDLKKWVDEAGKDLTPPEGTSIQFDFSFRKAEFATLQKKLA